MKAKDDKYLKVIFIHFKIPEFEPFTEYWNLKQQVVMWITE